MKTFAIKDESIIAQSINNVPTTHLPLVEMFYGIEGEGSNIGDPRILLRVSGCRIKCHGCDSPHTWNANGGTLLPVSEIISQLDKLIDETGVKTVAVTGGEPMHYPEQVVVLAKYLRDKGVRSWLETSGWIINQEVFDMYDFVSFDIKTPSSKEAAMDREQVDALLEYCHHRLSTIYTHPNNSGHPSGDMQIKFIVTDKADIDYILSIAVHEHPSHENRLALGDAIYNRHRLYGKLIITPACGKHSTPSDVRKRMELCMEHMKGLPYRIIAQQHPFLNMP